MIRPCGYQVANEGPQPRDVVCYLCHTSQLGAYRPGNGGDGTENQVNQVKILKSGAETVVMWSPRWGETWDTGQWWGDPGAQSRWWWPHWPWPGVTRLQRTPREMSHHSQAGGQWLQPGGHCVCDSAYSVIVSILSVSFIPGHWPPLREPALPLCQDRGVDRGAAVSSLGPNGLLLRGGNWEGSGEWAQIIASYCLSCYSRRNEINISSAR